MAVKRDRGRKGPSPSQLCSLLVLLGIAASSGGCASMGEDINPIFAAFEMAPEQPQLASLDPKQSRERWAAEYAKNPRDLDLALGYVGSLKANGQKQQALAVLQQATLYHGRDKKLAGEYGRLALELDQVTVASQMLELADDPAEPDWRVVMARGTVLAKQGKYKDAVPFFERAREIKPGHPSVMNNLALAYTMSGEAAKGEELLRAAAAGTEANPKVRQNLALVLGLQGKYDESTVVGAASLTPDQAKSNADLMRKIVKLDPKPFRPATKSGWEGEAVAVAEAAPQPVPAPEPQQPVSPAAAASVPKLPWTTQIRRAPAAEPDLAASGHGDGRLADAGLSPAASR